MFHSPSPPLHQNREGGLLFGILTFAEFKFKISGKVEKKNPILSHRDNKTGQHKNAPKIFKSLESLLKNNSVYAILDSNSKHCNKYLTGFSAHCTWVWRTGIRHYVRASALGIRFAEEESHPGLSPVHNEANPEHLWGLRYNPRASGWVSIVNLIK